MESEQVTNKVNNAAHDVRHNTRHNTPQSSTPSRRRKQNFFTVYNTIGLILCILFLPGFLISATLLVSSFMHPDIPPSCFGYTPLMVETGSMLPLFGEDDLLLIKNTPDDAEYYPGDVICFHSGDVYVTHRIDSIGKDDNGNAVYTTKGDANNTPDRETVRSEQILGVYQIRFAGMGKALLFIQTPLGMIVCVMLPILIVILLFTVPPRIEQRKRRKKSARRAPQEFADKSAPNGSQN